MIDIRVKRKQGEFVVDTAFASQGIGVTALFGRSGTGKTSVINMVAGLVRPDEGRIVVNERRLYDSEKGVHLPPEKRRIGYVFQDGRLFPHLSVRANLCYGMRLIPAAEPRVSFHQVVGLLGIERLLTRRPAKLSGGEKQRVAIGRALLTNPSLLLMDEPLASLDGARKAEVLPFIARLSRELSIPILYVTHSLDEIVNLADTLVLMDAGRATAVGSVEDLMSRLDLEQLTGHSQCGSVLSTVVDVQDDSVGLTHLRFPGGVLKVPRIDRPQGTPVRVRIDAGNVAIALERPPQISIQNILPGTVEEIAEDNGSMVNVCVNIGRPLLARITPRAKMDLKLKTGQQVFALVKSVGISRGA